MQERGNDKAFGRTVMELPLFPQYIIPDGGLTNERESHALFYYYILATQAKEIEETSIVYEGDKDPEAHYRQLFTSVAKLYNVQPDNMANAWASVDVTCEMHKLPKLPNNVKYRHRGVAH